VRRVRWLALGLAAAIWLPGCGPPDVTGISLADDGMPEVINCGTYVTGVDAADAATHRTVWAARIPDDVVEEHGGDAPVELGRVPNDRWVEDSPLALDPRPAEWVFAIDTEGGGHVVIRSADDDLAAGRVYRNGHHHESRTHLDDHTCNAPYLGPPWFRILVLAGLVCIGIAGDVGYRLRRRAEARAAA
jgi:hypothetical protein